MKCGMKRWETVDIIKTLMAKPQYPATWNFSDLFSGDTDPSIKTKRKEVEKKSYEFIDKWKERTDYTEKPSVLRQALDEYAEWSRHYAGGGSEGYYFNLRQYQELTNHKLKGINTKLEEFIQQIQNDIQFFELSISRIPKEKQQDFLTAFELKPYRHFLESLFQNARYLLSDKEERIMNLKSLTSHTNWTQMTDNFLSKEEREVLGEDGKKTVQSFSAVLSLVNSTKKEVRDDAARAFNDILEKHSDTAEVELNSVITNKKINDMIRGIPRPDLGRHLADDIDTEVVETLCQVVSSRFDIPARFYKLKAKMLDLPKLEYHERNVEVSSIDKKYPFDESIALIQKVFKRLDPELESIFTVFLTEGRMDVFPKKGKASGAFCAHYLISHPTYILLNHTDTLRDVLTIAHEAGHGINNELIRKVQNPLNFGTPLSTAEVASTFMEDFVMQELEQGVDEKTKLALLMMKLNEDISTIFRQIACYLFEQELHAKIREVGYLSKEEIGTLFQKHMAAYMGEYVVQSPGSQNWWVYWSHIRAFFYVYSYASGLLISKALQHEVKENPASIRNVKKFLSAGLSDSPKSIFHQLGIDITVRSFWEEGIQEIETLLVEAERLGNVVGSQ